MARIRTIKPEFWADEDLSALPLEAHMLAAALLNHADDEGYFNANPKLVEAACRPLREDSVSVHECLIMLSDIGYLDVGKGKDGKQYGCIRNFTKHQRINRPSESKIAKISITWSKSMSPHGGFSEGSHPEGNREQGTGNGTGSEETPPPADADEPRDPPGDDNENSGEKEIPKLAIDHLNQICGTRYQKTAKNLGFINARVGEGASLDEVKLVIEFKHREWSGDPSMAQYLRPETLFGPSKFPGYLAAAKAKRVDRDPGHSQPGYNPDLSRAMDTSRGFFDD